MPNKNIDPILNEFKEFTKRHKDTPLKVYVLSTECNNQGISESEVLEVFIDRSDARRELKTRKKVFIDGLVEDELPQNLDMECDGYTDTPDCFSYYRYSDDHAFSLSITPLYLK